MDGLYSLDSASVPLLWQNGRLRPAVRAAFAAQLMYYEERHLALEMMSVQSAIRSCYIKHYARIVSAEEALAGSGGVVIEAAAHTTLCAWGAAIRGQFSVDNLHLTSRSSDNGLVQVSDSVKHLSGDVKTTRHELASLRTGLSQTLAAFSGQLSEMQSQLAAVLATHGAPRPGAAPAAAVAALAVATAPSAAVTAEPAAAPPASAAVLAVAAAPSGAVTTEPAAFAPAAAGALAAGAACSSLSVVVPATAATILSSLQLKPQGGGSGKEVWDSFGMVARSTAPPKLEGRAQDLYLAYMARGGSAQTGLHRADAKRVRDIAAWFGAFVTDEEKALLLPPPLSGPPAEQGKRRTLAKKLNTLVVMRLIAAFETTAGMPGVKPGKVVPIQLKPDFDLGPQALDGRLIALRKLGVVVALNGPDEAEFKAFRAIAEGRPEVQEAAAAVAEEAAGANSPKRAREGEGGEGGGGGGGGKSSKKPAHLLT